MKTINTQMKYKMNPGTITDFENEDALFKFAQTKDISSNNKYRNSLLNQYKNEINSPIVNRDLQISNKTNIINRNEFSEIKEQGNNQFVEFNSKSKNKLGKDINNSNQIIENSEAVNPQRDNLRAIQSKEPNNICGYKKVIKTKIQSNPDYHGYYDTPKYNYILKYGFDHNKIHVSNFFNFLNKNENNKI